MTYTINSFITDRIYIYIYIYHTYKTDGKLGGQFDENRIVMRDYIKTDFINRPGCWMMHSSVAMCQNSLSIRHTYIKSTAIKTGYWTFVCKHIQYNYKNSMFSKYTQMNVMHCFRTNATSSYKMTWAIQMQVIIVKKVEGTWPLSLHLRKMRFFKLYFKSNGRLIM